MLDIFRFSVWDFKIAEIYKVRIAEIFGPSVVVNSRFNTPFANVERLAMKQVMIRAVLVFMPQCIDARCLANAPFTESYVIEIAEPADV